VSTKQFYPYQLSQENVDIFPEFFDGKPSDKVELKRLPIKNILVPKYFNTQFTTTTAINIKNAAKGPTVRCVLGGGDQLYMNQSSLYYVYNSTIEAVSSTVIIKFTVSGSSLKYAGSAFVEGSVLNQFSMDEYETNFRIATSNGFKKNLVTVFDSNLKQIGQLSGFAENENIKSVRFLRKRGYVVTFRNTDPLFSIDLSDPAKPTISGELKIPGFSEYLHPISSTILLGFGKSQSDEGDIDGLKLSLFDVSNPSKPKEISVRNVADNNSISEASSNHKAFVFDNVNKIVSFPIWTYDSKKETYNSKLVFYSFANNKLTFLGSVSNNSTKSANVNRAVFTGKYAFAVRSDGITTYTIKPLKKVGDITVIKVFDVK
jgi:uncharacterized secreted protein with C-terminal beta-propeller domain